MSYPPPPPRPSGNSPMAIFMQRVWDFIWDAKTSLFIDSPTAKWNKTSKGYLAVLNPQKGGGSGFKWQVPNKELDPTKSVSKDTWVYISPLNPLVTAGMTDIVTMETVISCEGTWVAAMNVPAAVGGSYNVPVFPYPSGMGLVAPSGTPLAGDLDSPTIFWIYRGAVQC